MAVNTRLSRSLAILQPVAHSSGFEPALRDIAAIYGLKHATCLVVRAGGGTDRYPLFFTTYPRKWADIYLSRSYFEIDPVVDIIRWARLPVDWSRLQKTSPAIVRFFEEARQHDVGLNGMTVPVRGPNGERSLFSVSSAQPAREWARISETHGHDFQILSHYMHDRVMSVVDISMTATVRRLSARERQCLEALASGLLPKQIAATLRISESAVRLYLRSARRKLGATTSYHAVARASLFELISV
ncbi:LuxR family transcriptional regulator [Rhizobiales bacterium RZME27]|uniref:LuxR family transcriptional regulator n=1 Tax=Endobacterium cereale TaxID=2663029 RepID=A0A6A8AB58_9HYPH|nr:LuxR family transcriptional regulator [Endobacterium cereale]MEB2846650.1 LuxR family transcriptional regulator [Endobacterium cereale]MQY46426.1 LuxR family transcriptional regulator [Endobacterium cereale]